MHIIIITNININISIINAYGWKKKHAQLIRTNVFEYKLLFLFVEVQSSLIQCMQWAVLVSRNSLHFVFRTSFRQRKSFINKNIESIMCFLFVKLDPMTFSSVHSAQRRGHRLRSAIKYNIFRLKSNNIFGFYFYQKHVEVTKCNHNRATILQHIPFRWWKLPIFVFDVLVPRQFFCLLQL